MQRKWLLLFVGLTLAVGIPGKRWAEAAEYDLCQRAGSELTAMPAVAYERAGRAGDAFASAVRLLNLDPNGWMR
ncbi:MAG: hypothetical protein LC126_23225 [Bryobacterales bacterium]|nr:hypothetical protein [Bryobacterales bacterium]